MSKEMYTRKELANMEIRELMNIARNYESRIPSKNKKVLIDIILSGQYGYRKGSDDYIRVAIKNAEKMPEKLPVETFTGKIDNENISSVLLQYYMFDEGKEGNNRGFVVSLFALLSIEEIIDVLSELGIRKNLIDNPADLISLLDIIPGIGWDIERAKIISHKNPKDLERLSKFDYFNVLLIYCTGYYLYDKYEDKEKHIRKYSHGIYYLIYLYLGMVTVPYISSHNYKERPLGYVTYSLDREYLGMSENIIIDATFGASGENSVDTLDYAAEKYGIVFQGPYDRLWYILHSLPEYSGIDINLPFPKTRNEALKNLQSYTDDKLLDIIEDDILYDKRSELEDKTREALIKYSWSYTRLRLCEKGSALSYGTALNYYCFSRDFTKKFWNSEAIRQNRGFRVPAGNKLSPFRRLSPNDLRSLSEFVRREKSKEAGEYRDLIEKNIPVASNIHDKSKHILIICISNLSDRALNQETYKFLIDKYGDIGLLVIEYISSDVMYVGDQYHVINDNNYPDRETLNILRKTKVMYDTIIMQRCPEGFNENRLVQGENLELLKSKLKDEGELVVFKDDNTFVNKIKQYFVHQSSKGNVAIFHRASPKYISSGVSSSSSQSIPTEILSDSPKSKLPKDYYVYHSPVSNKMQSKSNTTPIEYYLGSDWKNRWTIIENTGGGDCLYCVIAEALKERGNGLEIADLKEMVAQTVTEDNLEFWQREVKEDIIAKTILKPEEYDFITIEDKKINVSKSLKNVRYNVAQIRDYIINKRMYASDEFVKILSKVLDFVPVTLANQYEALGQMCNSIEGYILSEEDLYDKDIILIRLDVAGGHYDLIAKKDPLKKLLSYKDIPEALLDELYTSCLNKSDMGNS